MRNEFKEGQEQLRGEFKEGQEQLRNEFKESHVELRTEMHEGFKSVNERLLSLERTVVKIENEHGNKLSALFDGYIQNSEKLDRIELKVNKHEEFIIKRIKETKTPYAF
jgi:Flp pilus assembly protein TadB